MSAPSTDYFIKISFLKELAVHLHQYGTSAGRLESAINEVSRRLDVQSQLWASPTGVLLNVPDPDEPDHPITHMLRLSPGSVDLGRLSIVDAIAERVADGTLPVAEGLAQLHDVDREHTWQTKAISVFCFGAASGAVAGLLPGTGWADVVACWGLGWVVGILALLAERSWRIGEALEALAAALVTVAGGAISHYLAPLSINVVVVGALVALMPGLSLTTAVAELSSAQLMSGASRFAGAVTVLLKLTFGAMAGAQIVSALGWTPMAATGWPLISPEVRWTLIGVGCLAFAGLFRAAKKDVLLVACAVLAGHLIATGTQSLIGSQPSLIPVGTFVAALVITALSNVYSTTTRRPGALIRVAGIIMLVPGSLGFRASHFALDEHVMLGLNTAFGVVGAVVALVAGILIGNLIVAPRRKL